VICVRKRNQDVGGNRPGKKKSLARRKTGEIRRKGERLLSLLKRRGAAKHALKTDAKKKKLNAVEKKRQEVRSTVN
jgi:hypothetical protein